MAITITSLGTGSGDPSNSVTVGAGGIPVGATVIVFSYETDQSTAPGNGTVADSVGNTYTAIAGVSDANSNRTSFYIGNITIAILSGGTITFTSSHANTAASSYVYCTGLIPSPYDNLTFSSTQWNISGSPQSDPVTSGTPTLPGELMFGFIGWSTTNAAAGQFTQDTANGWQAPPTLVADTSRANTPSVAGGWIQNTGKTARTFSPSVLVTGGGNSGVSMIFGLKTVFVPYAPTRTYKRR